MEHEDNGTGLTIAQRARLAEAMEWRGVTQRDVARAIGIGETPLSRILSGKSDPKSRTLHAIMEYLRVRPTYVVLGTGPKYLEDPDDEVAPSESGVSGLHTAVELPVDAWIDAHAARLGITDEEREWLRAYRWPAEPRPLPDHVYEVTLSHHRYTSHLVSR